MTGAWPTPRWVDVGRRDVVLVDPRVTDDPPPPELTPCAAESCQRPAAVEGLCNWHWWHGPQASPDDEPPPDDLTPESFQQRAEAETASIIDALVTTRPATINISREVAHLPKWLRDSVRARVARRLRELAPTTHTALQGTCVTIDWAEAAAVMRRAREAERASSEELADRIVAALAAERPRVVDISRLVREATPGGTRARRSGLTHRVLRRLRELADVGWASLDWQDRGTYRIDWHS